MSFLHLQHCQRNITGVIVLPGEWVGLFAWHSADNRVSLSESQHADVYLQSGSDPFPPSINQTAVLCLFATVKAFMVTTHTQAVREVRPPVFQWKEMNGSHTPLRRRKDIKFGAVHPSSEDFHFQQHLERVQQCTVLLIFVFCKAFTVKCFNSNNPCKCLYKAEKWDWGCLN